MRGAIAVLAVLITASSAHAATLINPDGTRAGKPFSAWVAHMQTATYAGPVTMLAANPGCDSLGGCSDGLGAGDGVWIGQVDRGTQRFDLYHELGHEFDLAYLTDSDRAVFTGLMDDEGYAWTEFVNTGYGYPADGRGAMDDFADAYAMCAEGVRNVEVGPSPLGRAFRLAPICARIGAIGAAVGAAPAWRKPPHLHRRAMRFRRLDRRLRAR